MGGVRSWQHICVIGLVALGMMSVVGCGSDDTSSSDDERGTVEGMVWLEGGDEAVGAEVSAQGVVAEVDEEGRYMLEGISVGEVDVSASFEGYITQTQSVELEADEVLEVDFTLEMENVAPVIEAVVVEPEELMAGGQASVTVEAYDPNGGELSYTYEIDEDWSVEAGDEEGQATIEAPDEFGVQATLTVVVEDEAGERAEELVALSTREHGDPVVESISAVPGVLEPGATATLEVVANSPFDDELFYEWQAPEGWEVEPVDEATAELVAPDAINEEAEIEVVVTDDVGGEARASVVVQTSAGNAPVIESVSVDPPQVAPGGEMALEVDAYDPDGGELDIEWIAPSEWVVADSAAASTTVEAPMSYGESAQIEVFVEDSYGLMASATVLVSTITNQGPQIHSLSADPTNVFRGEVIDLEVVASHPQDDALSYAWDVPSGWTLFDDASDSSTASLEAPGEPGQMGVVEVDVFDSQGEVATASVMVRTEENRRPVIWSIVADPAAAVPGESQTVTVDAEDLDGEDLSYEWTVPSGWSGSSDSSELVLTSPDSYGQSGTVEIEVSDGYDTQSASVSVSTVQAVDPSITSFGADANVVPRSGSTTVTVDASHAYDEALSYEWNIEGSGWSLDGSGTSATVQAPDDPGSMATVSVVVSDDHGGEASAALTLETAANQAPEIASMSADEMELERGGSTTVTVDASDPDGGSLSYEWNIEGSGWSVDGSGSSVTVQATSDPSATATVSVEVSDDQGATTSESLNLSTVAAAVPVISDVEVAAGEWVEKGGSTMVEVTASHPDGDPLSYEWTVTGGWSIDGTVGDANEAELTAPSGNRVMGTIVVEVSDPFGQSDVAVVDTRTRDTEPDAFSIGSVSGVSPGSMVTSEAVELGGFDGSLDAVCDDCEVSVNGGGFSATASVEAGDEIELRRQAGGSLETVTAQIAIGDGAPVEWVITSASWGGMLSFGTCGQSGRMGPSSGDCDASYAGTDLESEVSVVGNGIQEWTVPTTGVYRLEASGARGGDNSNDPGEEGANGAWISGEFELEEGDVLRILVGQEAGETAGGGGTFITRVSSDGEEMFDGVSVEPLLVAGGGGGAGDGSSGSFGGVAQPGLLGTSGGECESCSSGSFGEGGTDGFGGGGTTSGVGAEGGGGFRGNGESPNARPNVVGQSFLGGGLGGEHNGLCDGDGGGFGGGAGCGHVQNAGGAGGYSGGGGSWVAGGGGGGSFNAGDNQDGEEGANDGAGEVTIDLVG